MEKIGRRSLWVAGAFGNMVIMATIGGLAYAPGQGLLWAIAILMNILISWQIVTMTSVGWVITAEVSSYRLRGKMQSIAVISSAFATWFFTFTAPYIYNTDAGDLGAKAGFVFMGSSVVLLLVSIFIVPDVHGFTTEEVDWLYSSKISVRHFQKYADGCAREGAAAMAR